jgi:hypothetical protein
MKVQLKKIIVQCSRQNLDTLLFGGKLQVASYHLFLNTAPVAARWLGSVVIVSAGEKEDRVRIPP